jgi:hypothetical protein
VLGWYVVRVEGLDVFWLMRANELAVVEWEEEDLQGGRSILIVG